MICYFKGVVHTQGLSSQIRIVMKFHVMPMHQLPMQMKKPKTTSTAPYKQYWTKFQDMMSHYWWGLQRKTSSTNWPGHHQLDTPKVRLTTLWLTANGDTLYRTCAQCAMPILPVTTTSLQPRFGLSWERPRSVLATANGLMLPSSRIQLSEKNLISLSETDSAHSEMRQLSLSTYSTRPWMTLQLKH